MYASVVSSTHGRIPIASDNRTINWMTVPFLSDAILTLRGPFWEPGITALLRGLEDMDFRIRGVCHPLRIRGAIGTSFSYEIRVEDSIHDPRMTSLNSIIFGHIFGHGTIAVIWEPFGAALSTRRVQVFPWSINHPPGKAAAEAAVGCVQIRPIVCLAWIGCVDKTV